MQSAAPLSATLFGLFSDPVAETVAVFVGFTTLLAGAARYGAVLARWSDRTVERATGVGFFLGAFFATGILLVDALN